MERRKAETPTNGSQMRDPNPLQARCNDAPPLFFSRMTQMCKREETPNVGYPTEPTVTYDCTRTRPFDVLTPLKPAISKKLMSRWPPTQNGGSMLPRRARRMEANLIT